jgi:SAM-dependent methyltransferase
MSPVLLHDVPITPDDPKPYGGLNIFSPVIEQQCTELYELCKKAGDLKTNNSILDFGCGTGRILPKLHKLSSHVVGFDICDRYLQFCKDAGFQCHHADVQHPEFNPSGVMDPDSEFLPFFEKTFDRVIGMALLNHQDPQRAKRIISEALRVTKKGGRIVFTTFLLNPQSTFQLNYDQCVFSFKEKTPEWWVTNYERPYLNCAIDETIIRRTIIENKGQIVEPIQYGHWRQIVEAPTGHDLIIIRKI